MGTIIRFPARARRERARVVADKKEGPATVVILPVIRIERSVEQPSQPANRTPRRRRRRASHS
jgi:hypothetical protein